MKNLSDLLEYTNCFEKMTVSEAKDKIIASKNLPEEEKREIINEVFNSTLYILYRLLNNSKIDIVKTRDFDIEDIISTSMEIWFEFINSKEFLEISRFSEISERSFITLLNSKLINHDLSVVDITGFTTKDFSKLLKIYIDYRNDFEFSYQGFQDHLDKIGYFDNITLPWYISEFEYMGRCDIITKLEKAYIYISNKDKDEVKLTEAKITQLARLILESTLTDSINNNVKDKITMEEKTVDKVYFEGIEEALDNSYLDDRQKDILKRRMGFYGRPETHESIASDYGVTRGRIGEIEHRSIIRLRKNPKFMRKSRVSK